MAACRGLTANEFGLGFAELGELVADTEVAVAGDADSFANPPAAAELVKLAAELELNRFFVTEYGGQL